MHRYSDVMLYIQRNNLRKLAVIGLVVFSKQNKICQRPTFHKAEAQFLIHLNDCTVKNQLF